MLEYLLFSVDAVDFGPRIYGNFVATCDDVTSSTLSYSY